MENDGENSAAPTPVKRQPTVRGKGKKAKEERKADNSPGKKTVKKDSVLIKQEAPTKQEGKNSTLSSHKRALCGVR